MKYLSTDRHASPRRRGVVLLVVLAMLTLFSVVALSFVFYAESAATAALMAREAQTARQADGDPEALAAFFLGQLIYPTDNIHSVFRGYELARTIYGYNPGVLNYTPYNGIGRASLAYEDADLLIAPATPINNYVMANYQAFWDRNAAAGDKTVNFVRTPEYFDKVFFGPNATPPAPGALPPSPTHLAGPGALGMYRYVGGANPPWTAPDTTNLLLAHVAADGTVGMPSGYRPWMTSAAPLLAPPVGSAAYKYASLRPDPVWNVDPFNPANNQTMTLNGVNVTTSFVTPDSEFVAGPPGTGLGVFLDVRNLESGKGVPNPGGGFYNNDSMWMDLGYPVMTGPDGRRYKPLFAPLIMDLSNRLHLWAQGNQDLAGTASSHASNRGYGPPEVNLALLPGIDPAELQALFTLRYNGPKPAGSPVTFPASNSIPWYAKLDADGRQPATGKSSKTFVTSFTTVSANATGVGAAAMEVPLAGVTPGGFPWAIEVGMVLSVDTGNNAELVVVTAVNIAAPTSFTATFTKNHAVGVPVSFVSFSAAGVLGPFSHFPTYPTGWDNAFNDAGATAADEITNRPLGFNLFQFPPPPMSHLEALLRRGGTNSPALQSEILRRMPKTFDHNNANGLKAGHLVTLWNPYLDRVTASPVINWDPDTVGHYQLTAGSLFPVWTAPGPQAPTFAAPPDPKSEFTQEGGPTVGWRSKLGQMLRVNLNRALSPYPLPDATTGIIDPTVAATLAAYQQADADRKRFAQDIYNALVAVTGAQDPNKAPVADVTVNSPDYSAARWLAQLAVNIVDYIDADDYATGWSWNAQYAANAMPPGSVTPEFVFGTELPRLVINEIYAQRDNDAQAKGKGKGKAVGNPNNEQDYNFFVELHNPLSPTPAGSIYPLDGGAAKLAINAFHPVYKVVVSVSTNALTQFLRDPSNLRGDLDPGTIGTGYFNEVIDYANAATPQQVLPANGAAAGPSNGPYPNANNNQGFYVLGPPSGNFTPATAPNLPTTYESAFMSLVVPNNVNADKVTVLLRRLAVSHLPKQEDPALPNYNPYITIDYVDGIEASDRRLDNGTGMGNNMQKPAFGRKQPYAANPTQIVQQTSNVPNQPKNTFFRHNDGLDAPFTWLTHLDRPLVNQLELLHVSGYKPHELTQRFVLFDGGTNSQKRHEHYAPWTRADGAIHRALEVLGVPSNMLGNYRGGRWQGNININTMSDVDVFRAMCDAQNQPYNLFTQADVATIYQNIVTARSAIPAFPDGRPFKSFASGDINANPMGSSVFIPPSLNIADPNKPHFYAQTSLFQKIYNNMSTTSNVFAVWVTVGFFEVVDENVRPARLGAEIGRAENRHIRHRFFAIVDRSGLQLYNTAATTAIAAPGLNQTMTHDLADVKTGSGTIAPWNNTQSYAISNTVSNAGAAYYCIQPNTNVAPPNAASWQPILQKGMLVEIVDPLGVNTEVVAITSVVGNQFTADFTKPHALGERIICRGNPGPKTSFSAATPAPPPYNPRRDTELVLHLSIIQ